MNCYEHTFITKQDLSESQAKKLLGKYEDLIKNTSGKISSEILATRLSDNYTTTIMSNSNNCES